MILKIRQEGGWVLLDGISKAKFSYAGKSPWRIHRETGEVEVHAKAAPDPDGSLRKGNEWQRVSAGADFVYLDNGSINRKAPDGSDDGYEYPNSAWITRDNTERLVLFHEGYFMNDGGQTIERIVS